MLIIASNDFGRTKNKTYIPMKNIFEMKISNDSSTTAVSFTINQKHCIRFPHNGVPEKIVSGLESLVTAIHECDKNEVKALLQLYKFDKQLWLKS